MNGRDPQVPSGRTAAPGEGRRLLGSAMLDDVQARARRERALQRLLSRWQESERPGRRSKAMPAASVLVLSGLAALALAVGWLRSPPRTALGPEPSRHAAVPAKIGGPVLYRPACPNIVAAAPTMPLIDDMEDGDANILARDARSGSWRLSFDGTGPMLPFAGNLLPVAIPGGRGPSQRALHVTGERLFEWGAFVAAGLSPAGCYDASAYAGLEFWAHGTKRLRVGVVMMDVVSTIVGGPCVEHCNGSHVALIELAPGWTHYALRWDDLATQPGQAPIELDLKRLSGVTFGVGPEDTPFDLWLDDLAFLQR